MKKFTEMNREELASVVAENQKRYDEYLNAHLSINMARGKPSPEQLGMSTDTFADALNSTDFISRDGTDTRNYGGLSGIDESKTFFAELLGVDKSNIIVGGSSSLQLMFDFISQCYSKGIAGCESWARQGDVKFIAVVPGYDRHFAIAEYFGIQMVNVPISVDGPDMDMVEELVKDPMVKGMFCVPKYSNPDGYTYSAETVERLAKMKPAAEDFRVIWDNAYIIHDLYDETDYLPNIFDVAKKYGNEDNFVEFASTSKVTFAGAGISCIAASDNNIKEILKRMNVQIISYDKMNQLRHFKAIPDMSALKAQMKKHADILRPKFEAVEKALSEELDGTGIASWHNPNGGYFIGLKANVGSAKYAGKLCKDAGLTLTNVGAAYPYGNDPDDCEIRIAPSYPSCEDLDTATRLLAVACKLAAAKELLEK